MYYLVNFNRFKIIIPLYIIYFFLLYRLKIIVVLPFCVILSNFILMAKGKVLSKYQQGQILTYKELKISNRAIAVKISVTHTVVNNFINLKEAYTKKKSTGRPTKLSARQKELFVLKHPIKLRVQGVF